MNVYKLDLFLLISVFALLQRLMYSSFAEAKCADRPPHRKLYSADLQAMMIRLRCLKLSLHSRVRVDNRGARHTSKSVKVSAGSVIEHHFL